MQQKLSAQHAELSKIQNYTVYTNPNKSTKAHAKQKLYNRKEALRWGGPVTASIT